MFQIILISTAIIAAINLVLYVFYKPSRRIVSIVSRFIVGATFIFSGFVKGVDPYGFAFKIEDYFLAYNVQWAMFLALPLSIFLCTIEFVTGIAIMFVLKIRAFSWILLLLMLGFTVITTIDALYSPVPDCGCFGSAIIISNWETFYKNIVLLAFTFMIFAHRGKIRSWFYHHLQATFVGLFIIGFAWFCFWNYNHLPVIDFMNWKEGKRMVIENPKPIEYYLTYKNKQTGETKEYLSPNFPFNDTAWLNSWEFSSQRIVDPNTDKPHQLVITDANSVDFTKTFIENPNYQVIFTAWDLKTTKPKAFKNIKTLHSQLQKDNINAIVITSTLFDEIQKFQKQHELEDIDFYNADDTEIKTMVRSNPGMILLKNATVINKWHWRDFPGYDKLKKKWLK